MSFQCLSDQCFQTITRGLLLQELETGFSVQREIELRIIEYSFENFQSLDNHLKVVTVLSFNHSITGKFTKL